MLDFPVLSTVIHTGKFLKLCVIKIILDFYFFFSLTKKIRIRDQIEMKILIFH